MTGEFNADDLTGNMKYSYEQYHIFCMIARQRLMLQKGNYPVREAMLDDQWFMISARRKKEYLDDWEDINNIRPEKGSSDEEKGKVNYERIIKKTQLIGDVLDTLNIINYAPPSEALEILNLGMEEYQNGE